jgi:hypothetical protein
VSNSVRSNPIGVVPTPRTATASGRVLLAFGKRGPLFDAQPATAGCTDCNDFQTVMIRDGRSLVAVDCRCVTPRTALAG